MDAFNILGVPLQQIEFALKIIVQTAIVVVGFVGNIDTIYNVRTKSNLPRTTNMYITAISLALILQTLTACIDYVNHIFNQKDSYALGWTVCDTWHTLNVYLPMLLALLCFFALMDRYILLARPDLHNKAMSSSVVVVMVVFSFLVPLVVTIPPVLLQWHTNDSYINSRTKNDCKYKTNIIYALLSPVITFWIPVLLIAIMIIKIFKTMALQDRLVAFSRGVSLEKFNDDDIKTALPWKGMELQRQQRLALILWSVYWNITLFWIPQFVWQYIYNITGVDWPKATNFMAWAGYMPCLILPCLYHYYNIYEV